MQYDIISEYTWEHIYWSYNNQPLLHMCSHIFTPVQQNYEYLLTTQRLSCLSTFTSVSQWTRLMDCFVKNSFLSNNTSCDHYFLYYFRGRTQSFGLTGQEKPCDYHSLDGRCHYNVSWGRVKLWNRMGCFISIMMPFCVTRQFHCPDSVPKTFSLSLSLFL